MPAHIKKCVVLSVSLSPSTPSGHAGYVTVRHDSAGGNMNAVRRVYAERRVGGVAGSHRTMIMATCAER